MMKLNRRNLLAGAAALPLSTTLVAMGPHLAWAQDAAPGPVDPKALMEAPTEGEMELGNKDAKVTVIEYASSSCPHCADFYKNVFPQISKDYIEPGKIRFIFREFPHNDAGMGGFMVARCAPKEKYFPIVDVLFKTQEQWLPNPLEGLKNIALQAGFTQEQFTKCLQNQDVAKGIWEVRQKAEGFGVTGIPTFFINGERYEGEYTVEAFKKKLDELLA